LKLAALVVCRAKESKRIKTSSWLKSVIGPFATLVFDHYHIASLQQRYLATTREQIPTDATINALLEMWTLETNHWQKTFSFSC